MEINEKIEAELFDVCNSLLISLRMSLESKNISLKIIKPILIQLFDSDHVFVLKIWYSYFT